MRTKDNIRIAKLMGAEIEINESIGEYVVFPNGVKIMTNDLDYDSNIFSLVSAYEEAETKYGVKFYFDLSGDFLEATVFDKDDDLISYIREKRNIERTMPIAYDLLIKVIDCYEKNKQ